MLRLLSFPLTFRPVLLFVAIAALAALSTPALQASESQCILAGRINNQGRWAPQAKGMQLLDAAGKPVSGAAQSTLSNVKAVRLSAPALLSQCNAGQAVAEGAASGGKSPVPALKAGNAPIEVQAMATLPGRAGGQWVELRVSVPAERVVMLTR